jgi:hypothetical protein
MTQIVSEPLHRMIMSLSSICRIGDGLLISLRGFLMGEQMCLTRSHGVGQILHGVWRRPKAWISQQASACSSDAWIRIYCI